MKILPVIDLLAGQVVRGIAGRRSEYRPIVSQLCGDASPASVARAFVEKLQLTEAYVADLDAIGGAEPAWTIYESLVQCGLVLWVDAGVGDIERAKKLADWRYRGSQLSGIVVGLETVPSPDSLAAMMKVVGIERLVFSLDLKTGKPLTTSAAWRDLEALQIAETAIDLGIQRMIVLDLASVGMGAGVSTESLCRQLHTAHPNLELTAGGGVRGRDDLISLRKAGCSAALVASALHDGRLTLNDLQHISLI